MTLKERVKQLRAIEAQLPEKLKQAATGAAIRAVDKATELTPPKTGDLRGTNTRSGEMKQHWATDSKPVANRRGNQYVSLLQKQHGRAASLLIGVLIKGHAGKIWSKVIGQTLCDCGNSEIHSMISPISASS